MKLNLTHLIGSKVLRSYMHGFFINTELYDKVNLISNPNSIYDQRKREIANKINEERKSRILTSSNGNDLPTKIKVNKDLVNKLQTKFAENGTLMVMPMVPPIMLNQLLMMIVLEKCLKTLILKLMKNLMNINN